MYTLDYDHLLDARASEVAQYLRNALGTRSDLEINQELLKAIEDEIIPSTIISIWLPFVRTPVCIVNCLLHARSIGVRKHAIIQVGQLLQSARWKEMWLALGGVPGLLDCFSDLSVYEVQQLCKVIGWSYKYKTEEKTKLITELAQSLLPVLFPHASFRSNDQRSLQTQYLRILPSCSNECVTQAVLYHRVFGINSLPRALLITHTTLLQSMYLERIDLRNTFSAIRSLWLATPGHHVPSVEFQMTILRYALSANDEETMRHFEISALVPNLWNRAIKQQTSIRLEIIQLCVEFYTRCPYEPTQTDSAASRILRDLVGWWGKPTKRTSPAELPNLSFDTPLRTIIRLSRQPRTTVTNYIVFVETVVACLRYRLLRMLLLEHYDIDIDSEEQLKDWKPDTISVRIMQMLEPAESIALLSRLKSANPNCQLFRISSEVPEMHPFEYSGSYIDHNMLLTRLHRGDENATMVASKQIEQRKHDAIKCRDQPQRAFYAKTVVAYASLGGSLLLLSDALTWIRRFSRDPLTVRQLYTQTLIGSDANIRLLSGLPQKTSRPITKEKLVSVSEEIKVANSVLHLLLDTALEAIREPSFDPRLWHDLLTVSAWVVDERMRSSLWMERVPDASSDDIYHAIFPATIELLLHIEDKLLQPGYEVFKLKTPGGILSLSTRDSPIFSVNILKFYDNLALARNKIWYRHRLSLEPDCALIPTPFPQGLPLQCFIQNGQSLKGFIPDAAPYIMKRITDIVFMQGGEAVKDIPAEDNVRRAIGPFVDNIRMAMSLFILQTADPDEMMDRVKRIWSHWKTILRDHKNMTEKEATLFLRHHLQLPYPIPRFPEFLDEQEVQNHPQRPSDLDVSQQNEWNPAAQVSLAKKNILSKPKIMDCFMSVRLGSTVNPTDKFFVPTQWKLTYGNDLVLSIQESGSLPAGKVREGLILTALLLLDSKLKNTKRHITSAFPSNQYVRYPPVYLDLAFLQRTDATDQNALRVLHYLKSIVPPTLLASITKSYLESMKQTSDPTQLANVQSTAFALLKSLSESDKPHLAGDMIIEVIIDQADSSSWHRYLFGLGFIRRLPKVVVSDMFKKYSDIICQRLEHQNQTRNTNTDANRGPLIKVTTVKQLAQMLDAPNYISPLKSVDIIARIFKQTTQIDILTAVVHTLMARLPRDKQLISEELIEATLSALELTIPIVGAFNERQPLTELQWQDLEDTLCAPELFSYNAAESPPVIQSLLRPNLCQSIRERFATRVLLPAAELSSANNKRALEIILRKKGISESLPEVVNPFSISLAQDLLEKYHEYLPCSIFKAVHELAKLNIQPPSWMSQVSLHFKSNNELLTSREGRLWFSFFDVNSLALQHLKFNSRLLSKNLPQKSMDRVDIQLVQGSMVGTVSLLIELLDKSNYHQWMEIETVLNPYKITPVDTAKVYQFSETRDMRPVLEAIISKIDSLRTDRWQSDRKRQPAILPSTLKLRSWLLPYPELIGKDKLSESELKLLSNTLIDFAGESINLKKETYSDAIEVAYEATQRFVRRWHIKLVCRIGETCSLNLDVMAWAQLSLQFIRYISLRLPREINLLSYDSEAKMDIERLLESWEDHFKEEVRMRAFKMRKEIEQRLQAHPAMTTWSENLDW